MNSPAITSSSARAVTTSGQLSPRHLPENGIEVVILAREMMARFAEGFPFEGESGDAVTNELADATTIRANYE
jgi:hypothetical protein